MTITIVPKNHENLYGLLLKKEQQLRPRGAFYRVSGRFNGFTKWHHKRHNGWIWLGKSTSGVLVVEVETKDQSNAWQILSAFVGFLDRHFQAEISCVNINYPKT